MEARSLRFIAAACQGKVVGDSLETQVTRVCTDSRQVRCGDLFFALSGEKFDAHDFLADVAGKGATALVIATGKQHKAEGLSGAIHLILVDDPRLALGRLAARYRTDFDQPLVAIGGSNGKTTTKELLAAILRQKFETLWSEASFNNDVGVPLTLMKLESRHGAAVLEAGTNHPGELKALLQLIRPEFGVVTNIGREHLEFFGNLEGVALEEGAMAECLPPSGKLFLNGDNEWTPTIARRATAPVIKAGLQDGNDWRAASIRVGEDGVRFQVNAPKAEFSGEYRIRLLGRHQVSTALLALAAGTELGVSPEQARRGLEECTPPKMRLQTWDVHGVRVIDDAYNANADSMLAALQTLRDFPCHGRRVAVLGDMAELGDHTAAAHEEIGRKSAELGLNSLVTVGRFARVTAEAAQKAGMQDVTEFEDVPSAAARVKELVRPGDVVLLKASRSAGLEAVTNALRGSYEN
jgi:UDP-N-acetylmuramoyl-tripeptide--D-alanyl-D-alanine ligase